jgi:prepilin-type N-terminal cleavage/methylation domain-containing protein
MNKVIKQAFTLIELLVVIAIIGILSGLIAVGMNGATSAAQDSKKKATVDSIKKSLIIDKVGTGTYPIETGCTIGVNCHNLDSVLVQYLPSDLGATYTYESNGTCCKISTILSNGHSYQYDCLTSSYSDNAPINGSCGTANKTYVYSVATYGSDTFCAAGTANPITPAFPALGGSTTWTCTGINGGIISSACTASRGVAPVAGSCGTKNGKYASTTPSGTQACATGTLTDMTGTYSWTCAGQNGGTSSGVCATVAATYAIQSFTNSITWTVPAEVTSVDYLVVGGGGGGGGAYNVAGGGGGGGGVKTGTGLAVSGTVSVVVGAGGAGGLRYDSSGGGLSSFGTVSSSGGGAGDFMYPGGTSGNGYSGGSGGGSVGGGGGGAGGVGSACGVSCGTGGNGGPGVFSSITGSYYGGGGGGGGAGCPGGSGGSGGGGAGANGYGGSGAVNTGGGGGGAGNGANRGGNGGSGVVVIKYINNY